MAIGFSKTFGFERTLLAKAVGEFKERDTLSRSEIMSKLGIGSQKAEAIVLWLGKLGLRDNKKHQLTPLGTTLIKFDPYFDKSFTQWIFHYKLASNPDAEVWYLLSNEFLPGQMWFFLNDAINFLVSKGLRSKNDKHLRADVSIFLRSFISANALGKTEYLKIEGNLKRIVTQNKFCKNPPSDVHPYLIAFIIYDQREKNSPNLSTITIEELLTLPGNVGRIFSLSRAKLEEILKLLSSPQYNQLIYLATTAGLDQVSLKFKGNPLEILEMYFVKKRNEIS
jgi:hypothetical protein